MGVYRWPTNEGTKEGTVVDVCTGGPMSNETLSRMKDFLARVPYGGGGRTGFLSTVLAL